MMSPLSKLILAKTGLSLKEFVEQYLGSEYKTWQMRQRKKKFYPAEVVFTCWVLGVSCQEAFGYPFTKMVLFQGKYGIPEKLQEMWKNASYDEKGQMLAMVGFKDALSVRSIPVPKEKPKEKELDAIDFFQEIISPQAQVNTPKEESGSKPQGNDPLKDLFIETY